MLYFYCPSISPFTLYPPRQEVFVVSGGSAFETYRFRSDDSLNHREPSVMWTRYNQTAAQLLQISPEAILPMRKSCMAKLPPILRFMWLSCTYNGCATQRVWRKLTKDHICGKYQLEEKRLFLNFIYSEKICKIDATLAVHQLYLHRVQEYDTNGEYEYKQR